MIQAVVREHIKSRRFLPENLTVAQLVKKFPCIIEPEMSSTSSQDTASGLYPEQR
jgi:hypothetical protein